MATPGNLVSSVIASKTKTKKKHFVAQKVKLFRASDPLLSVLMWGVNHSSRGSLVEINHGNNYFGEMPLTDCDKKKRQQGSLERNNGRW
ncbi:phosphatidylinositol 5-phosphate 4-kinase type-2 alpha-like [Macrotis lagotis]|uniref:phosphatidylinositol 5-phosphate 4-kinase type-2 alpha-like n=1 Tax=Macrotis lagotis TaxID=92651 RepID=UPI003D697576